MLVNAFVGAMVGLERTVVPLMAQAEFDLASKSAVLSFVATFGVVKALTNYFAGRLSDRYGRRRILIAGWLFAIPVPLLVMWAPSWGWVVFANVLLGINQGLAWSTTVIMKIDLVGSEERGLAMGLNEFAGYLAVAASALATGYLAESMGLRPEPFYLGIGFVALGLGLSLTLVRETHHHMVLEAQGVAAQEQGGGPVEWAEADLGPADIFAGASWRHPALSTASHAGMVNNLNDGLAWGLFPIFFASAGLSVSQIGILSFLYPAVWGALQLLTGALSDKWGRKPFITGGMLVQAVALAGVAFGQDFWHWAVATVALGAGTAMVYPTLLAVIGDVAHPRWRGSAVGIYRLWRDGGYAVGALLAGGLADLFGIAWSIAAVAGITLASGLQVAWRMPETLPGRRG